MMSLRTPQIYMRLTMLPRLRECTQLEGGLLRLRTRLDMRPAARLVDLASRDPRTMRDLGFPVHREIAQPREWRGRVERQDDDTGGWWLQLVETPSGMEIDALVGTRAFGDLAPSAGLRVLVRTWFEWADGMWQPRREVAQDGET